MEAFWEKNETSSSLETMSMRVRPRLSNFAKSLAYTFVFQTDWSLDIQRKTTILIFVITLI